MSGYVDKTERASAGFIVERRTSKRTARLPMQPTEEQIHRAVIQHLDRRKTPGVFFYHPANGEVRHKGAAGKLKGMGTVAGVPDIVIMHRGHSYGLELKRPGEKQSPEQKLVEQQWERAGGTYAVAHGLDYALDTLREWGLLQ